MITTGTRVKLHGQLAQEMGREDWEFLIERPREAIAALEANSGGRFFNILRKNSAIEYRVLINGKDLMEFPKGELPQEMWISRELETMDIMPVPAGAGGLWQTIIGVVLIIVGVVLNATPFAPLGQFLILAGISLVAGGIGQMLSPSPKLGIGQGAREFKEESEDKNKPNYLFSGIQNTSTQGGPVPICYGEMFVGSQLVSLGLHPSENDGTGVDNPPGDDDDFYEEERWKILHAQARAEVVKNIRVVNRMTNKEVKETALLFDFPTEYPITWANDNQIGKKIPVQELRKLLKPISHMFNHNLQMISYGKAKKLYRLLSLNDIEDPPGTQPGDGVKGADWREVVGFVGDYYVANP